MKKQIKADDVIFNFFKRDVGQPKAQVLQGAKTANEAENLH